jgi:hypothetical protein
MSKAIFNPVIYRPLFTHLQLVTCRTFETPAANTIPLFALDEEYIQEIYGECALELLLPGDNAEDKMLDIMRWPERYGEIVRRIRHYLADKHSHAARFRELMKIVEC